MEILIGGRKQIGVAVLQIPKDEDAWVEFDADTWHVKINLVFVEDPEKPQNNFQIEPKESHAQMIFYNWNNSLPGTSGKPLAIGENNGKKVSILVSGYAVDKFKFLTLSFFWEN